MPKGFRPQRAFPVIVALLLTSSAWLAGALDSLILATLLDTVGIPNAPPSVTRVTSAVPPAPSASAPLARLASQPAATAASVSDCTGIRALIVTESDDETWSTATLLAGGDARPRMRRVGDRAGDRSVVRIGTHPRSLSPTVWLSKGDDLCEVDLFAEQTAPVAPMTDSRPPSATSLRSLVGSVRVVPDVQAGRVRGLRLFGLRPGSLLTTLGFENGDRLESINGHELVDAGSAIEAYARLRQAQRLKVVLSRRGQRVELDYHID